MRRIMTALSPVAALAITWLSLQSLLFSGTSTQPATAVGTTATTVTSAPGAPGPLPEFGSVSHLLAGSSSPADGATVPASIREVLIATGTVLLVPDPPAIRGGL